MRKILLIIICILCIGAGNTTETRFTTVVDSDASWTNPDNIKINDGSNTTTDTNNDVLVLENMGSPNIPYKANITGIEVLIECRIASNCGASTSSVKIQVNYGNGFSSEKTVGRLSNSFVTYTTGNSGELWIYNEDINSDLINDETSFSVQVTPYYASSPFCTVGTFWQFQADYVSAVIYYKMPFDPIVYKRQIPMKVMKG